MRFDGEPVVVVLVEEWLKVERELYLALTVDREIGAPLLLTSDHGGVHIEERIPEVLRLPLDPWIGPRPYHLRRIGSALGLPIQALERVVNGLWRVFCDEDAFLVEINPLGVCEDNLVALDARVVLDDNARYRHDAWPSHREGTRFETQCAELGASGIEMEGDISLVSSGAGLGMASLDLIVAMGGRVRSFVDLGSLVFQEPDKVESLMALLADLQPKVVLLNFFLQLARCETIATGLARWLRRGFSGRVVFRMRGMGALEASNILRQTGALVYEDLNDAFRAAVDAAAG